MRRILTSLMTITAITAITAGPVWAHDPIFGMGPHVLFKGGFEVAPEVHVSKQGNERETEFGLELVYGLTGDWAIGMELPYAKKEEGGISASGRGDASLFTKYRFWRHDTLGAQESMAILAKIKFDTATDNKNPALGSGTRDTILGFAYGYEGRKWYRFASIRHRRNGKNDAGLRRGDKWLLDFVGGIRFKLTGYREPDTVWLLELNGEYGKRAESNGVTLANTGGTEWFLSPGIFWTKRNFAIKAGVQIPIASDLNGRQEESDYRAKLVFEWHL